LNNQTHAGAVKGPGNTQMYQLVLKIPEEAPGKAIGAGRTNPERCCWHAMCPGTRLTDKQPRGNKQ
jgi:hypothetical protein